MGFEGSVSETLKLITKNAIDLLSLSLVSVIDFGHGDMTSEKVPVDIVNVTIKDLCFCDLTFGVSVGQKLKHVSGKAVGNKVIKLKVMFEVSIKLVRAMCLTSSSNMAVRISLTVLSGVGLSCVYHKAKGAN